MSIAELPQIASRCPQLHINCPCFVEGIGQLSNADSSKCLLANTKAGCTQNGDHVSLGISALDGYAPGCMVIL